MVWVCSGHQCICLHPWVSVWVGKWVWRDVWAEPPRLSDMHHTMRRGVIKGISPMRRGCNKVSMVSYVVVQPHVHGTSLVDRFWWEEFLQPPSQMSALHVYNMPTVSTISRPRLFEADSVYQPQTAIPMCAGKRRWRTFFGGGGGYVLYILPRPPPPECAECVWPLTAPNQEHAAFWAIWRKMQFRGHIVHLQPPNSSELPKWMPRPRISAH